MRALIYYTAFEFDLERIAETEDEKELRQNMIDLLTPMCKGWCTEVGLEVYGDVWLLCHHGPVPEALTMGPPVLPLTQHVGHPSSHSGLKWFA